MTSSQIKAAGISVLGVILLVGFQNCSPTNCKSAVVSSKVEANGGPDPVAVQTLPLPAAILADGTPGATQTLPTQDAETQSTGSGKSDDDNDQKIAAESRRLCDKLAKNSTALASGLNIVDNSGSIRFSSASFGKVQNNSGSVHLFGTSASRGHVASLENNSGMTLICRLDVDSINATSGKVVIVDGDVGSIANVSGLILVGGKIKGSVSRTSGEIRQIK